MPTNLVVLELFACQGGATSGYMRAGYTVFAVELEKNHLKYSPANGHHQGNAYDVMRTLNAGGTVDFIMRDSTTRSLSLSDVDLVHASPPCQYYTRGNAGKDTHWARTIPLTRELLIESGKPYVIENVKDAGYDMLNPIELCGCMFNMHTTDDDGETIYLHRSRLIETNWVLEAPSLTHDHSKHEWVAGAYGGARRDKYEAKYIRKGGYVPPNKAVVAALLGVTHTMTWAGLFECIPPAYAEYVGEQFHLS